jgi:alcohol dehydrogenase class IV
MIALAADEVSMHIFRGPHEVVIGDGSVTLVGEVAARWSEPGKILIVTDSYLADTGLADRVAETLRTAGFSVEVFAEVAAEPDEAIASRVATAARTSSAGGVVGLGGGSSLDLAKIAAAALTNDVPPSAFVGVDALTRRPAPLVLVPTTAGTGSEATQIAMLTVDGKKRIINDSRLVAQAAILDPALTVSLPPAVTAATGLDAISHALEALISRNANALTAAMSAQAIRLLSRALLVAYRDGGNLDARRATLYGAHLAGRALNAGSVLGHAVAYTIANRAHLAHGITCAMALRFCLVYGMENPLVGPMLDELATDVADPSVERGLDVLGWLGRLNDELGVPAGLRAVEIDRSEVPSMASECMDLYPRPHNPVPLERGRLERMYEFLWADDLGSYLDEALEGRKETTP